MQIESSGVRKHGQLVGSNGRALVNSVSTSKLSDSVSRGRTWNIGTGQFTLTNATASALMYIKNTDSARVYEIDLYVILSGTSTGGTGRALVEVLKNPTGGTLVTAATTVDSIMNMNFGQSTNPNASLFKLTAINQTLTGQSSTIRSQMAAGPDRLLLPIVTQLPPGGSVGIRYTPPSGNTSQVVEAVVEMFEIEDIEVP